MCTWSTFSLPYYWMSAIFTWHFGLLLPVWHFSARTTCLQRADYIMASPLTPCLLQSTNTEEAINIADTQFTQLVLSVKVCDPLLIHYWSTDRMWVMNSLRVAHHCMDECRWPSRPRTKTLEGLGGWGGCPWRSLAIGYKGYWWLRFESQLCHVTSGFV